MPGVLQIEALAQTGGLLCINAMPKANYDTYFLKIQTKSDPRRYHDLKNGTN